MPKISVIVPVYRAQDYLDACVQSILSQTFSDLELILVDDGSPDQCPAMCDAFAQADPRVRVLHQSNQGQAAARNHALDIAAGEWVCFVDSDDLIHRQMLELLYAGALDSGAAMSMCRMCRRPALPPDFHSPRQGPWQRLTMDEDTLASLLDRDDYPGWEACAKLIRREVVEVHRFCPGRVYEDNEAVCHWLHAAGTLALLEQELYFYRTNPDSTTQGAFSLKKLDYLWALEQIMDFFHSLGYDQVVRRFAKRYAEAAAGACTLARQELGRPDVARQIRRRVYLRVLRPGLPLDKADAELLLDAMHPRLIRLYWPAEAAVRALRDGGPAELLRRTIRQMGKGEDR